MKTVLVCKTTNYEPSFFVAKGKGEEDGDWINFDDPDDMDEKDIKKVAAHLGITPKALSAFLGVIEDLRNAVEEDILDLYEMINK
jgi:hypothetical protein